MAPLKTDQSIVTIATESTWGTGVTATAKLMTVTESPTVNPGRTSTKLKSIRGSLAASAYVSAVVSEVPPNFTFKHWLSYQDTPYLLEPLTGTISPTGANPYVRAGNAPLTAIATPRKQTIYVSNLDSTDGYFYKYLGAIGKKITITAKTGEAVMADVEYIAKQVAAADATTAATGSLNDRSVDPIMADHLLLYMDAIGGTIGTTAISPPGYELSMTIDSNRTLDKQMGSVFASNWIEGQDWSGNLTLKLIWSASSKAYVDAMFGSTTVFQKLFRLKFTTGSSAIQQFDFGGEQLQTPAINEGANETVVVTLNLDKTYSSTLGNWFKHSNTNAVSTLA